MDLSGILRGRLRRDERFGYLKLALRPDVPAKDFIRCWSFEGRQEVEFVIEQTHDLEAGARTDLDPWA